MTDTKQLQLAVLLARVNPCVDAEFRVTHARTPHDIAADVVELCRIGGEIRNNFGHAFSTRAVEWQARAQQIANTYDGIVSAIVLTSGVLVCVNDDKIEV